MNGAAHHGILNLFILKKVAIQLKDQLIRVFEHAHWANNQILQRLQLYNEGDLHKPVSLFAHVLSAEKIWLTRLNRKDSSHLPIWPEDKLEDIQHLVRENYKGYLALLKQLPSDEFSKGITYRNQTGQEFTTSILDILTHVSHHGSYHRGQIASYLKIGGFEPVSTDYITFVRL